VAAIQDWQEHETVADFLGTDRYLWGMPINGSWAT
jgi:hypothetical protein